MHRHCLERLKNWALRNERNPMVLRGARQVGKTTLVRLLANDLKLTLVELNLEKSQNFTEMLDKGENARDLIELILLERGIRQTAENLLLFFDEAQELPGFYAYLRYFKEYAPEYRIIAAGSLFEFEIKRNDAPQGPTGRVEYSYLEPMSFEEFLMAKNQVAYKKLLSLSLKVPVPEPLHKIFSQLFKEYMVSGGMPAVVKAMCNNEGPLRIDEIKSDIITGYLLDLPKYSQLSHKKYDSELLELLFKSILSNPANGMKYSELAPGYRAEVIRKHLNVMEDARIIRQSFHSGENSPPLLTGIKKKNYKLFSLDVGLCYSYMDLPLTIVYASSDINDIAKGILAEQYVAQTLASLPPFHKSHSLYHWQRQKRNAQAEVDFVVVSHGQVIPLECKSGYSSKMISLKTMLQEKPFSLALRIYAGNIEHENLTFKTENRASQNTTLISMPHYLLERFMSRANEFLSS